MILIVTDVASRGIDILLLDNVVNWDFPHKLKIFVHRIGRATRLDRTRTAYSFLTPDEIPYLLDLHLFLLKPIRPKPDIGWTGGIASGKSTVSKLFKSHGIPIVDTDIVARDVLKSGTGGWKEVAAAFGEEILLDLGEVDRAHLGQIVCSDLLNVDF